MSRDQFTESDISNDGQHNYADYDLFDANFTDDSARTSTPTTTTDKNITESKKRKVRNDNDAVTTSFLETLSTYNERLRAPPKEDDEDMLFARSVVCKMKKMDEDQKTNFKIEILIKANECVKKSTPNT